MKSTIKQKGPLTCTLYIMHEFYPIAAFDICKQYAATSLALFNCFKKTLEKSLQLVTQDK
jgi:hypothetical protein